MITALDICAYLPYDDLLTWTVDGYKYKMEISWLYYLVKGVLLDPSFHVSRFIILLLLLFF